mgnify:FL=1
MINLGLYIYTFFKGIFIGKDEKGNKYYKSNISHGIKKEKRWVLYYRNNNDPTTINPGWHAWLHHIIDNIPDNKVKKKFKWQKKLSPNLTGTKKAYKPEGHLLNKQKSFLKKRKNYESWDPNKK